MATWQFAWPVTGESYGTGDGTTLTFTHTPAASNLPIYPGSVTIKVSGTAVATDDGAGNITGATVASGTITYSTGAMSITFSSGHAPANTAPITVNYSVSTFNLTPSVSAVSIFTLKQIMKAAGWTVVKSSDGTTYNSSGDQITKGTSGTGGMDNASAWFVIQQPNAPGGGTRQMMFQRSTTLSHSWAIGLSYSVGYTSGSPAATVPAQASDNLALFGTFSSGIPSAYNVLFGTAEAGYRFSCAADSTSPYGVWSVAFPTGGGIPTHGFCVDSLLSGSYQSADPDPYIYLASGQTTAWTTDTNNITYSVSGAFITVGSCKYIAWPGSPNASSWVTNVYTGKDDFLPVWWYRASHEYKGTSYFLKWGVVSRTTPTPYDVSTLNDSILMGNFLFPWPSVTPTI